MMTLTFTNLALYLALLWSTNSMLNMLYVLKKYVPVVATIDTPIDTYKKIGDRRIIGNSATVLGIVVALGMSIVWDTLNILPATVALLGPILVYIGHTLGSFIKRRVGLNDGEYMLFVDHGNYAIVAGVVLVLMKSITVPLALVALAITYIVHPLMCQIAYRLKLKKYPY